MKNIVLFVLLILAMIGFKPNLTAQDTELTPAFKESTIVTVSKLMKESYIFLEVAEQIEDHLLEQWETGHFNKYATLETFAEALTESVRAINNDKHMRIRPIPPYKAPENTPERMIEQRMKQVNWMRSMTGGFHSVEKMEGNVGYLDLRGFAPLHLGKPVADDYMRLMATSDAIIIDLRKNGGGSPEMVQYLCSYFFDKKVHLNSLYYRVKDLTIDYWTLDEVTGEKMPDIPLFVITGDRTFSAAEEFSYNMQTQKRATLVGQTTGGGANPGETIPINEQLSVFVPSGRAINPITKTNWEGVGVIPEVVTTPEEAKAKAHELAKAAAEAYRAKTYENYKVTFAELNTHLENYAANSSLDPLLKKLRHCEAIGLMDEGSINGLGYTFLMDRKQPKKALAIFKANTILHPNSANVYDSYAETLASNGDVAGAMVNYKKAVKLGEENKDPSLPLYKENLAKMKSKAQEMGSKK